MIGEIFDNVQYEGGTHFQENVQTTLIPAGGSTIVEFHTEVPGTYIMVDHSIFRAFNKGALALLEVAGEARHGHLFRQAGRRELSQRQGRATSRRLPRRPKPRRRARSPRNSRSPRAPCCSRAPAPSATRIPARACRTCSRRSPSLTTCSRTPKNAIDVALNGLSGKVTVNGKTFDSVMPPMSQLNDDESRTSSPTCSTAGAMTAASSARSRCRRCAPAPSAPKARRTEDGMRKGIRAGSARGRGASPLTHARSGATRSQITGRHFRERAASRRQGTRPRRWRPFRMDRALVSNGEFAKFVKLAAMAARQHAAAVRGRGVSDRLARATHARRRTRAQARDRGELVRRQRLLRGAGQAPAALV